MAERQEDSKKKMRWRDALAATLREVVPGSVVTSYRLGLVLWKLVRERAYGGRPLTLPNSPISRTMFTQAKASAIDRQVLREDHQLPPSVFRVLGSKDADVGELLCQIDPFGHIAYLSAMAQHGLTNRLPRVLYFRTLDPASWTRSAQERMAADLGDDLPRYLQAGLPSLRHSKVVKLDGQTIELVRSKDARTGWRYVGENGLRVSTIGRTFLDMLQRPDLCGGIRHVIELFEEHAEGYLQLILKEISVHGSKIDQARAGFILEDRCRIKDPTLDEWAKSVMRGGSRKLDPHAEYFSTFSERWCLSINV